MLANGLVEDVQSVKAGLRALFDARWDVLNTEERLQVVSELGEITRMVPAVEHLPIAGLVREATFEELGGSLKWVLAGRLRITTAEANRKLKDAADLGPRTGLSGEPLAPRWEHTAAAQREGRIGVEHVKVIRAFFDHLPAAVDPRSRARAELDLATCAQGFASDTLAKVADRMMDCYNPDGDFSDEIRAAKRGFTWKRQGHDGMSVGTLVATPELRASIDAIMSKWAAPGMCNPADQTPTVDGEPSEDAAHRDLRTVAQRQHDAFTAVARATLSSGTLGLHKGLPVTVIVSTTLQDLEAATGKGVTAGGTLLPMTDVIRTASHAHHYLTIFDKVDGRALWLGRTKRTASADQRIVLHAKDRGCTAPGCTKPGYLTEVHHIKQWVADHGLTDIDDLTLTCREHHPWLDKGWKTRKRADGRTEWIPPTQLDLPPAVNEYHHPENLIGDGDGN